MFPSPERHVFFFSSPGQDTLGPYHSLPLCKHLPGLFPPFRLSEFFIHPDVKVAGRRVVEQFDSLDPTRSPFSFASKDFHLRGPQRLDSCRSYSSISLRTFFSLFFCIPWLSTDAKKNGLSLYRGLESPLFHAEMI